ncbi:MAG TPA: hypothetical protein VKB92_11500 [Myxococcales bacterium]|nr:hypothetical protein [Myxococcales bacterium]
MPLPQAAPPAGALDTAARLADRLRWFFVPVALCALVAVGVHTAADVVGGLILRMVDAADAAFDSVVARWALTAPLVDLVGPSQRIFFARGVALLWELAADALLALPMLGYDERADEVKRFRELAAKAWARPTTLRAVHPLATAAVALAGSCAVGRLLEGTLHFGLRGALGSAADALASGCALAAVLGLVAFIAWRGVVHALVRADARSDRIPAARARAFTVGLPGALLLLPLAIAALRAAPLLFFLR